MEFHRKLHIFWGDFKHPEHHRITELMFLGLANQRQTLVLPNPTGHVTEGCLSRSDCVETGISWLPGALSWY